MTAVTPSISKIRSMIPVEKKELPKFIFTAMMMLLVVYVYSILRASKDSLVVSHMGAELLSAIKLAGVLPSAVLFMLVYTRLVNIFDRVKLFHIINWFFVSFFCLFSFVLYPNSELLYIDFSKLIQVFPYLRHFFVMVSHWSFSLFYIMSELWGSVLLSLLFWQLANQITSVQEAKRFYPLFGFLAQAGLILAGILGKYFASLSSISGSGHEGWHQTLNYVTLSVLFSGLGLSYCLWFLCRIVGKDAINGVSSAVKDGSKKKSKVKLGFIESLKYIMSSRYIGLITLLILCYGTSINLVEGIWKKSLGLQYQDPNSYSAFMGSVQIWTGICTAIAMLFGSHLLQRMSWRSAAMLTPVGILVTGLLFFVFMMFRIELEPWVMGFGLTAIYMAAWFGGLQNVLGKSVKYSFFDPTKEMSYIPLDDELKSKGKAAADVIGGRLGKSSGAFIQQIALIIFVGSDLLALVPGFFAIFLVVSGVWIWAVCALSKEFEAIRSVAQPASSEQ